MVRQKQKCNLLAGDVGGGDDVNTRGRKGNVTLVQWTQTTFISDNGPS